MWNPFKRDPITVLQKAYELALREARDQQRGGDVVAASELIAQAERIRLDIEALGQGSTTASSGR